MNNIVLQLDNAITKIHGKLSKEIYQAFKKALSYEPPGALWQAQNNPYFKGYYTCVCWNREHCRCHIRSDGVHFPTGLISKAIQFFNTYGVTYKLEDIRDINIAKSIREKKWQLSDKIQLYPYQADTVKKAIMAQRGILKMATGSGKTLTCASIIAELGVSPTVFYVTSTDLLVQAKTEIERFVTENNVPVTVGAIGGGFKEIKDITIMTVQTAVRALNEKYIKFDDEDETEETDINDIKNDICELIHSAKLMICDECITGDSVVITEDGPALMKDLNSYIGKKILSYDEVTKKQVWKEITHFYNNGEKNIFKITTQNGRIIKCTENHKIMTQEGWKYALNLKTTDLILSYVNADVKQNYIQKTNLQADFKNMYLDIDLLLSFGNTKTKVGEKEQYPLIQNAYHLFQTFINCVIKTKIKKYPKSGLIKSDQLDSPGEYATTEVQMEENHYTYIPKVIQNQKSKLYQNGLIINTDLHLLLKIENTISSALKKKLDQRSTPKLENMFQNAWNIKLDPIIKIEKEKNKENVFDITVKDTHCFFANGLLVHNCQHVASESCQIIAHNSFSSRWRYGASATPMRDLGDDMLIDACFGKTIVDISASYLIQNGFLVKPNIAFIRIDNMKNEKLGDYPNVYKEAITNNVHRNTIISQLASNLENQGRSVLVLIKNINHGEILQSLIPNSVFLHGSCTKSERLNHIEQMRLGNPSITIASSIFDEGVDIRALNSLILAGGGKSSTRALQRVGRVIRPFTYGNGTKKTNAFVYDFHDVQKYLTNHSNARRRIYASEPEFEMTDVRI